MKIRKITLNSDEDPAEVVVKMTTAEAYFITKLTGKMNGIQSNEVCENGDILSEEIYGTLTGCFFNRFWEEGVDGARAVVYKVG